MFEFNEKQLWKERIGNSIKEYAQYLKYIFNGHLVLVFVFLLGTAAYYYQEWLSRIPQNFPVSLIMCIILAWFVTASPTYTFLKDADRIFLIPVEVKMATYFIKCMLVSFILQIYILFIALGVFMPMYAVLNNNSFQSFWYFFTILFAAKGLNMLIRWHVQYFVNVNSHYIDNIIRYLINAVLLYFVFSRASILFIIILFCILAGLYLYYQQATRHKGIKWEFLIAQDEKRLASFYLFANMFTDVPQLKNRIKRRRVLDVFVRSISFDSNKTFTHLFWRTFFRSGDYLGLVLRLTIIGGITLFFLSFGSGQVLLAILFLFLTGLQLIPLWNAYQDKLWVELYPLPIALRIKAFKQLLSIILSIEGVLLSFIILIKGDVLISFFSIAASLLFTFLFVTLYVNKKRLS
ncbi:ABC transporter permease [Niallia sp. NCCP-28]|uniref:ABC transporter permease n=1 Tax=Niallia sp. NCCP-28 TaxID=2934712 RepID=UPI00207EC75B|nr:ABC transporter permease [Niallia sp. NCCP-28]GKU81698.1 ABC transporter permease [Niallia sp. NCCP-28]